MSGLDEFFHMGGYAVYVWSSYGIAAVVLIANVVAPWLGAKQTRAQLERQQKLERRKT
jgi:heme exporter protein D